MDNYISINGQKLEIPAAFLVQFTENLLRKSKQLADIPVGDTFKLGSYEFIVLEQLEGECTAVILKELLSEEETFGENNRYEGSRVDTLCNDFAETLIGLVGEDNLITHTVDLTADDGLKDYGEILRKASLLTADDYRRYVYILDSYRPDAWWWLSTPFSTKAHTHDTGVKCVAPSGCLDNYRCHYDFVVRPFCILKSTIFVSG